MPEGAGRDQLQRERIYTMHSSPIRRLVLALLAVFAFGAVAAASAQAVEEEAPFWVIEGTRLGAGETHYITAKISNEEGTEAGASFVLTAEKKSIKCTGLKLKEGVLLGSAAGNPGTNDEVIEFTKCTVEGNGEGCKVKGEAFTTKNLKSELVKKVGTEEILVEFSPISGATLATIEFEGAACVVKSTAVTGSVAAMVLGDPANLEKSELVSFPAMAIKEVLLVKSKISEVTKVGLTAFGGEATLAGTALVSLANAKHEAEETSWGQGGGVIKIKGQPIDFKKVAFGNTSTIKDTITVPFETTFGDVTVTPNPPFGKPADTCSKKTILANKTCEVSLLYTPTKAGEKATGLFRLPFENTKTKQKYEEEIELKGES
jgi:hypothetical protein